VLVVGLGAPSVAARSGGGRHGSPTA
jgi:hypothetical protein